MYDGTIIDMVNENESADSYQNVLEWLPGRIAGLQIYYTRYGTPVPFIRNSRAAIFVDEMPVDADFLNNLPVTDIAMIKIIKGPFAGAVGNGPGGVIAIYTLKGDDDSNGDE
jgi:outer membrane receptor protein involved in Fe transport